MIIAKRLVWPGIAVLLLALLTIAIFLLVRARQEVDLREEHQYQFCRRTLRSFETQYTDYTIGNLGSKLDAVKRYRDDVIYEGPTSLRLCLPLLPTYPETCVDEKHWSCLANEAKRAITALWQLDPLAR
ncbi:MAG: hypothetical protein ACTHU0_19005 [Kofleriaceae bacterium]